MINYTEEQPQTKASDDSIVSAEDRLLKQLQSNDEAERHTAIICCGKQKCRKAFPGLVRALDDEELPLRGWAAWALGEIGDKAAVRPIIAALKKSSKQAMADPYYPVANHNFLGDMFRALETLSGEHFGDDLAKWDAYVRQQGNKLP